MVIIKENRKKTKKQTNSIKIIPYNTQTPILGVYNKGFKQYTGKEFTIVNMYMIIMFTSKTHFGF